MVSLDQKVCIYGGFVVSFQCSLLALVGLVASTRIYASVGVSYVK
jgi:hypothetical protein